MRCPSDPQESPVISSTQLQGSGYWTGITLFRASYGYNYNLTGSYDNVAKLTKSVSVAALTNPTQTVMAADVGSVPQKA